MMRIFLLLFFTYLISFTLFAQLVPSGDRDDINISGTATSVNDKNNIPAAYALEQNFPNPFNPSTKITFSLPETSVVNSRVFNLIGLEVKLLVNGMMPAGIHEVVFDASELYSGVYFYTLKTGNFVQTRKMILIK
jgi:hypothetical protein